MQHPPSVASGGTTNVVEDQYGSGRHGFTDGSPLMWDVSLGVNGDATEVVARWCNSVTLNTKNACIEANGAPGPAGDDVADDTFELAKAVNSAANVLTGESSFIASGLEFATDVANFNVTLSLGKLVFMGRKYHVTAANLNAITVVVDGSDAGTGNAFALIASRDHYVSIGPLADDDANVIAAQGSIFTITVQDVANGATAPSAPADETIIGVLVTDGTGVQSVRYYPRIVLDSDGQGIEVGSVPSLTHPFSTYMPSGTDGVILPRSAGADIGSLSTASRPTQATGGKFVGSIHARGLWLRSGISFPADAYDGRVFPVNRRTTTAGAAASDVPIVNLTGMANSSAVRVEITVVGFSDVNQVFSSKISRCATKTSVGVMGLVGADVAMGTDHNPGALACTLTTTASGNVVRATITGAAGHNFTWMVSAEVFVMGGI